jgi:hypothetical protein
MIVDTLCVSAPEGSRSMPPFTPVLPSCTWNLASKNIPVFFYVSTWTRKSWHHNHDCNYQEAQPTLGRRFNWFQGQRTPGLHASASPLRLAESAPCDEDPLRLAAGVQQAGSTPGGCPPVHR